MIRKLLYLMVAAVFLYGGNSGANTGGLMAEAESLRAQGTLTSFKDAAVKFEKAAVENPGDFDTVWKCARGFREYGNKAKEKMNDGWKDVCAEAGKKGMKYAEMAIQLSPARAEGYFYYGVCAGIYSDGVSVFQALKEGLKDKIQGNLEKAYEIDKTYEDATVPLALGRFWVVVPWPYRDTDKAMSYYKEYLTLTAHTASHDDERNLYVAELFLDEGGKDEEAEARTLIAKALKSDNTYYKAWAEKLKEELD